MKCVCERFTGTGHLARCAVHGLPHDRWCMCEVDEFGYIKYDTRCRSNLPRSAGDQLRDGKECHFEDSGRASEARIAGDPSVKPDATTCDKVGNL